MGITMVRRRGQVAKTNVEVEQPVQNTHNDVGMYVWWAVKNTSVSSKGESCKTKGSHASEGVDTNNGASRLGGGSSWGGGAGG